MTWQPIETAPRDGRFFIGANAEEAIVCNWPKQARTDYMPGNWRRGRGEWNGSFIRTSRPLTHWQPLPNLPCRGRWSVADPRPPLWEIMEKATGTVAEWSDVIRAVRDWLPRPKEPGARASDEAFAIWEERKAVYSLLTAEAERAERRLD